MSLGVLVGTLVATVAVVAAFETAWELQDANAAALGEVCLDGAGNFDAVRAMLDGPADRFFVFKP